MFQFTFNSFFEKHLQNLVVVRCLDNGVINNSPAFHPFSLPSLRNSNNDILRRLVMEPRSTLTYTFKKYRSKAKSFTYMLTVYNVVF